MFTGKSPQRMNTSVVKGNLALESNRNFSCDGDHNRHSCLCYVVRTSGSVIID